MATTSATIVFITSDDQAADTTAALGFRAVFPTELHMNQTLGQSTRAHRAANAKATTQTLPVVDGLAR